MELQKAIGKRIVELRKNKGISQEKLAALSDLHEDYIGKIERGERTPSIKKLNIIIRSLNSSLKDFFSVFDGNI